MTQSAGVRALLAVGVLVAVTAAQKPATPPPAPKSAQATVPPAKKAYKSTGKASKGNTDTKAAKAQSKSTTPGNTDTN